jgi:uncharacterized membrane protein
LWSIALLSGCTVDQQNPMASARPAWRHLYSATAGTSSLLDGLNGSAYIIARSINDQGVITGQSGSFSGAVRWETGTGSAPASTTAILVASGGDGLDINAYGQIAGRFGNEAAVWTPNGTGGYTRTNVGLPGAFLSSAYAINAQGEVVGNSRVASGSTWVDKCFLWRPDSPNGSTGISEEIQGLGGNFCVANDINAAGQIVGASTSASTGTTHGFISSGGVTAALAPLTEGTYATAINDGGQIAGFHGSTAALWNPSGTGWATAFDISIPALSGQTGFIQSVAMDINDAGFVVGYTRAGAGIDRPFFWNAGEVVELSAEGDGSVLAGGITSVIENRVIVAGGGIDHTTGVRRGLRWTVSLTPVITEGCSERLRRLVAELRTGGFISAGIATSLTAKADAAARQAGAGKTIPAGNLLSALIEEVNALQHSGRLDPSQAESLREAARCVIGEL